MATVSKPPAPVKEPKVASPEDSAKKADVAVTAPAAGKTADPATAEKTAAGEKQEDKRAPAKGDKKPRRERPPLPDEIPTAPVKRYPEPSRVELQARIEERDAIVKGCFDKLSLTRGFYDKRTEIRQAGKDELDAARRKMNKKNDECRELFEQRKTLSNGIKALREADIAARSGSSSRAGKEEAALRGLKTVQEVDDRIAQLEYEQHTLSLTMQQEKKLVSEISWLKHTGRDMIKIKDNQYKEEAAAKKGRVEKRQTLEAERKALDTKIDAAKAELNVFKKEVDGIRGKQDEEIKKLEEKTSDIDRDAIRKTIDKEKAGIRKMREDFQVELDKWYLNERIHYEQLKIAKKKKWEAQKAEREARQKAWEEEQAQYPEPDPYQKEKDMCAGLTAYLKTLLGESVEKTATTSLLSKDGAPTLKANDVANARTISSTGKAIGKGKKGEEFEALAFSDFMGKRKPKGKKGKRPAAAQTKAAAGDGTEANLKPCSIDLLAAFTHLEITPPMKFSEVREALDAVKSKQDYYDNDPAPPQPTEKPKQTAPKPKTDKKQNGNPKAPADRSNTTAFPGLNSADDGKTAGVPAGNESSRPSYGDIAKGSAVAPSMGAAQFPDVIPDTMMTEAASAPDLGSDAFPDALEAGSGKDSSMIGDNGLSQGSKHDSTAATPQEIAFSES